MPKVTVIMPALNVVQFIKPCLDSVCGQTMQDLEILFIDAGSTDGTLEIVREYVQKDNRIRLIHSDKKSYGYQVNLGISEATGEYVGVVETDDLIVPEMFEVLYGNAMKTQASYIKGFGEAFYETAGFEDFRMPYKILKQQEYDEQQGIVKVIPCERPELVLRDFVLWNGIYRSDFIKSIRLNETPGAAYQDIGFMLQVHMRAESAVYLDKMVYHYRRDNPNASCYHPKAFHYLVQEYEYVDQLLYGKSNEWHKVCCCKLFRQTNTRFNTMAQSGFFWGDALPDIEILTEKLKNYVDTGILDKTYLSDREWSELTDLLESPHKLYEYYSKMLQDKFDFVQQMTEWIGSRKAIIFGSGRNGKFLHALMETRLQDSVQAFCDNQQNLWGSEVQSIPVMSPQQAAGAYPDAVYLITGRLYEKEMRKQLMQLHVSEEKILTYTAGVDVLLLKQ